MLRNGNYCPKSHNYKKYLLRFEQKSESKPTVLSILPPSLSHYLPQTSFSGASRNHKPLTDQNSTKTNLDQT